MACLQSVFATMALAESSYAQALEDVYVSSDWKNVRLEEAFVSIQNQTDFFFTYDRKLVKEIFISNVNNNIALVDLLRYISSQTNLQFSIFKDIVYVLREKDETEQPTVKTFIRIPEKAVLEELTSKPDFKVIYQVRGLNKVDDKIVKGKVAAANGEPLVGATVVVKETGQGTVTDNDGNFAIAVPDNQVATLMISYIGYQQREIPINGQSQIDVTLAIASTELEQVVVKGVRKSLANALEIKNESVNVVDAIVAEDIAKFPHTNVSEALQRISGVQIRRDYNGGVGNEISVRGLSPEYTQVTINGVPATTNADDRTFNFNVLPAELFRKAEVIKSPTADIDEGGLAGTVNLETLKPFDLNRRFLTASVEGQYNNVGDQLTPRASLVLGNTWNNKFGILIGAAYDQFYRSSESFDAVRWTKRSFDVNGDKVNDYTNVWFMDLPRYIIEAQDVERTSLNASVQYRPTDRLTLTLDGLFVNFDQTTTRYTPIWFFNSAKNLRALVVNDNIVEYADFGAVELKSENQQQANESQYFQTGLTANWNLQNWNISANLAMVSNKRDSERFTYFSKVTNQASYDIREDFRYWNLQTPVNIADPNAYTMDEARRNLWNNEDSEYTGRLDVERKFKGWLSGIRFGARYRDRTKERSAFFNRIRNINEPFAPVAMVVDGFLDNVDEANAPASFAVHDWDKAFTKYGSTIDLSNFEERQNYYNINEAVASGYLLAKINTKLVGMPFDANFGVRVANTAVTSTGEELDNETKTFSSREVTSNYTDFLPNFNARLKLFNELHFRAGFARVLTRPALSDLAAYRVVDDVNKTISAKNPELDPFRANQFDLALEWYPNKESLLSASFFHKDIESFITTESRSIPFNGDTYVLTQPVNGNAATITGFEINFQTPFTFLPSPFDGFGTVLNYTFAESTFEEELNNGEINKYGLPNHSKHSYNLIGYYEKYGFRLTLAHNFRSNFLREKPNPTDGLKYRDDFGQTDLSAGYDITKNIGVTFNIINLFNNTWYEYIFQERLMDGYFTSGRTFQFGLRASF